MRAKGIGGIEHWMILTSALAVAGCQFDPYPRSYSRTRPEPRELIGNWVATSDTRKAIEATSQAGLRPRIELFGDGRIRILDVPGVTWESGAFERSPAGYEGRWTLFQDDDGWWGLQLDKPAWFCSDCLVVLNDTPPRLLVIRYGDPDSGLGFEFERVVEQSDDAAEVRGH